ncbi:VWA domain-containing protein [Virgibacillus sp. NKC19-3]|uniref:VWA domain-containing protein n=1 Tax=Virgibacillus saliphilus TaxID=2831674 RepID=UPI001C9B3402|nr:VWA domain-containing protein [Virgibacillus sp. NKC19-3]MBY7142345.1 VWA domain-containing protein [Virgibacillus sp. NKC19-3]
MRYKLLFSSMLMTFFLLFGCTAEEDENNDTIDSDENKSEEVEKEANNDEDDNPEQTKENDEEDNDMEFLKNVPDVPNNTSGFIHQKQGKYASMDVIDDSVSNDILEEIRNLEPLPEDASEEQLDEYFKYLYSMVAEDFPDPQDTIKKWEFGSFGDPDLPDERYHFKENYNVEVMLDASGSMGAYIGDKTMMQIAKESINDFMKQVPEEANVSFRVYGHEGTGSESDKELSCEAIEQVYGFESYDEEKFQNELDKIEPAGWTPLADALVQSEEALKDYDTENNTNLIYVVSDGIETCGGDPVKVAESLSDSNAQPIINIIGFNVDSDAQEQLKEMADVSGGVFATANNQEQLEEEFDRAEEVLEAWEKWKKEALNDLDATGVENNFDIIEVSNEWGGKKTKQFVNLSDLTRLFEKEGLINSQQRKEFYTKRDDVRDLIEDSQEEVKEELNDISTNKIEEMKENIKEKYNNQKSE